nr:hypothetical protein [Tanacetum cinerariifolium]
MALTFVDTHNMIAYLTKSDASKGFNEIIDFLNRSSIKYALTVNLNIYVSCIKQFWTSVSIKKVNDVMRLQALVDKKRVIIMKATIRDALQLADAKGIDCLPNEEIFTELARMRYENPSTKLTFYKAFFSSLEITKLKQSVKKLERRNKLKVSKLRRLVKVGTSQKVETSDDTVMDNVYKQGRQEGKEMEEEDIRALKRISESQEDKATKKKKLDEEVVEQKRHLQIVPNVEDDIYTEATPLARKVPVVDYEIYTENNKPYYKIIRADGSPWLFLSFLSLLRNFDREYLEVL